MPQQQSQFDPSNPMHVAVRVTELAGAMNSMQQQLANSQQGFATAIQSLQVDMHRAVEKLQQITVLSEKQTNDNMAISRVWSKIESMEQRESIRDKRMNTWAGIAIGISAVSSMFVGTIAWFGNQYMEKSGAAVSDVRQSTKDSTDMLDARLDRVEIHLAGDGNHPYRR